jgi:voltage-gated potassium channel
MPTSHLRHVLYRELEPLARHGMSLANRVVVALILLSVTAAVIDSEPLLSAGRERMLASFEMFCGSVFLVEYLLRAWVCVENPHHGPGWRGRLHYLRTPGALLDLVALLPLLTTFIGAEAFVAGIVRMLRLLRLARFGRFSAALTHLREAVSSRAFELIASVWIGVVMLLVTSTLMYLVEGRVQPQVFGSIPRAMWWAIVTLTTVGYGDAVPVTVAGKVLAAFTAVVGVGAIAIPTGILASAFSDAVQRHRRREGSGWRDAH